MMHILGLARWEAWSSPLQLIRLDIANAPRTPFALDAKQRKPRAYWNESVYPADRERVCAFLDCANSDLGVQSIDYRLVVGDGELLWVRHWLLSRTPGRNGRCRLQSILMAIPEQKHLEWECLRVSERECNRVGQELHDDLCQVLAGLTFMMSVLRRRAAINQIEVGADIDNLNQELHGALTRVRAMAHGLFPAQLNYATLQDALDGFARQIRTRFAVELKVRLPRRLQSHSAEQIIHVYRIAQEAVSNSIRHGNARCIKIQVGKNERRVTMTIEDNGKGFPHAATRPEGIGLHVMQYRARALGGELEFRNRTRQGAVVQLQYTLDAPSLD